MKNPPSDSLVHMTLFQDKKYVVSEVIGEFQKLNDFAHSW